VTLSDPHGLYGRKDPAWHREQEHAERILLDQHIRAHLTKEPTMPLTYDPDGDPAPVPQDDDLEQAA